MTLPPGVEPVFSTAWPEKGKRWHADAGKYVGVYALQYSNYVYVGMTVSSNGFKGRWAKHHRSLFVVKRANATTKAFRKFIKDNNLTAQDFTLHAVQAWPNPKDELTKDLTNEIALAEQLIYDAFAVAGFDLLNNVRPRGTGYEKAARRTKRRRRRPRTPTVAG